MPKLNRALIRAAVLGIAAGSGAMLYREHLIRNHPLSTPSQLRINRGLDRILRLSRDENTIRLDENSRYIIFSDHHRGARDNADDFQPCETTYQAALDYYFENGYTLILLGDIEELWENPVQSVMDAYANILISEQRFYPDRYIRLVGNHDGTWNSAPMVAEYLEPYYPGIQVLQGLVFEFDNSQLFGEIFLAHGHQGTLDADYFSDVSPRFLPAYRRLQNRFGIGHTSPSTDEFLRGEHDTQMYRWASKNKKLILIAGHTHRPVWSSLTHLDQLFIQLYALRSRKEELGKKKYSEQYQELLHSINKRIAKDPPVNDTLKTIPSYFNTGCCRFSDGDITGIEITGSSMGLVKWDRKSLQRMEPISMQFDELFAML
jgi:hypothetical protein